MKVSQSFLDLRKKPSSNSHSLRCIKFLTIKSDTITTVSQVDLISPFVCIKYPITNISKLLLQNVHQFNKCTVLKICPFHCKRLYTDEYITGGPTSIWVLPPPIILPV